MPLSQKIAAVVISLAIFIFTIELVRKRRLREEYSVLWLATSLTMFVLVLKYDWLVALTDLIGAILPTTTLFLGAIVFLLLVAIQFSISLSRLSNQMKNLAQENALLRSEIEVLQIRKSSGFGEPEDN